MNELQNRSILNMVIVVLIESIQHENRCCVAETSAEVNIIKIHSVLDNTPPHF